MSILPGHFPAAAAAAGAVFTPASLVFNGTNQALTRVLSTMAPNTTIFTYSVWVKVVAYTSNVNEIFQVINAPSSSPYITLQIASSGGSIQAFQDGGTSFWDEFCGSLSPIIAVGAWEHLVVRYDSTQAASADRMRIYRNGVQLAGTSVITGAPGLNAAHYLFQNGYRHEIGGFVTVGLHGNQKLAFIDVLNGVSAGPDAFAFTNGSVWTRKPYAGAYGTYGFRLDGSDGFNDLSGNGQHFTGQNMTPAGNLDFVDLPPFTT